jgi:hypothetical protein
MPTLPTPGVPKVKDWTSEVARRALLALVGAPAPQILLMGSCVGGAGVDEGQARVNRFVVIAPCPRRHPQPDAVLLESHQTADLLSRPVPV